MTHVFFAVFDFGEDLDVVTSILGVPPSQGWVRGDPALGHPSAKRMHSRWQLDSGLPATAAFEAHLLALLDKLEALADAVGRVAARFRAVVWAAIYTAESTLGVSVSADAARRLGALGLAIDFDIYRLPAEPA